MERGFIDLAQLHLDGIDPEYFATVLSYYNNGFQSVEYDRERNGIAFAYAGTQQEVKTIIEDIKTQLGCGRTRPNKGPLFVRKATGTPIEADMWQELLRRGDLFDYGGGHVAYGGLFLELFAAVDRCLSALAAARSARAVNLPNFVPMDSVRRLGLVDEFPQYMFFVAPLVKKVATIEQFQQEKHVDGETCLQYLEPPGYCLKTAACSLLYPSISGRDFDKATYFTTLGSISRRESMNVRTCERLVEFHQRELVFVGNDSGAKAFQAFAVDLFKALLESFDLNGSIVMANDSFFVSNYSRLRFTQQLGSDKYEAVAIIPFTKAEIAVASFNYHRGFFSKRFGFSFQGGEAATACIGIGLERLVYAVLCHHGLNRGTLLTMVRCFETSCEALGRVDR